MYVSSQLQCLLSACVLLQFIASLLAGDRKQLEESRTKTMSRRKNNTVASSFSQSLSKLIATMTS